MFGCEMLENVRPIGSNLRLEGLKVHISDHAIGGFGERPIGKIFNGCIQDEGVRC